jgi:hypothetical protein
VPHPVVARVVLAISVTERAPACHASRMAPLVTPLHWQIVARSGMSVGFSASARAAPPKSSAARSCGAAAPRSKS